MNKQSDILIRRAVERAPDFLKQELVSKDALIRSRAEETLASIIAVALAGEPDDKLRFGNS